MIGSGTGNSTAQFKALCDTYKPLPAFIEGWALNSFMGVSYAGVPTNTGLPTDSEGERLLSYIVTGVAGASTITINSGDLAKFVTYTGMVVTHDDGTYGLYTITNLVGSVCTVFPNVRSTITSKTMTNFGGSANGQHLTELGYKALARKIYATDRKSAYRMRYAAKWKARTGLAADWTAVGGIGSQFSMSTVNPALVSDGSNRSVYSFCARGKTIMAAWPSSSPSGKGVTKTFSLGGNSGFLEAFASCAKFQASPNLFFSFRCVVVVDGVTLLDQTYTENDGLQRIIVPYTNGTSGTITFTITDATVHYPGGLNIGDITWWAYDRTPSGYAWTDSVIDKNAKTVVIGDSWTARYSNVLGTELQAAMIADGGTGTVVNVGLSGTTAQNYGLSNFDSLVVPQAPAQVVILFFTNDHNAYGDAGYERWLKYMYQIGRRCQAIGARPIFVMPLPTQSFGQAVGHGIWAEELGAGLAI